MTIGRLANHVDNTILTLAARINRLQPAGNRHLKWQFADALTDSRRQFKVQRLQKSQSGSSFNRRRRNSIFLKWIEHLLLGIWSFEYAIGGQIEGRRARKYAKDRRQRASVRLDEAQTVILLLVRRRC